MPLIPLIILVVFILLLVGFGFLCYTLFKKKKFWALATIIAVPVSFLMVFGIQSYPIPVLAILLIVIPALLPLAFFLINKELFKKTWIMVSIFLIVLLVLWNMVLLGYMNHEVKSEVKTINPTGTTGTALVVYHPGRSDFQETVNTAFAEGLAEKGWSIDMTTASSEAPTDLSKYDLLVLGTPTYDWAPSGRIKKYLKGLSDLGGKPTVIIVSAAGSSDQSVPTMEKLVQQANGKLIKSFPLWTLAPNDEMYGISDPVEIMRQAANDISLP
jgi:hypothetical protein